MTVKSESEELDDLESESFDHLVPAENIWKWFEQDWVSSDGELLTEYVPSEVIEELLTRYR